jgi:hypothetical protein
MFFMIARGLVLERDVAAEEFSEFEEFEVGEFDEAERQRQMDDLSAGIEQSRHEFAEGRYYTLEEVWERLEKKIRAYEEENGYV